MKKIYHRPQKVKRPSERVFRNACGQRLLWEYLLLTEDTTLLAIHNFDSKRAAGMRSLSLVMANEVELTSLQSPGDKSMAQLANVRKRGLSLVK
jgi:hypothetical protein